MRLRTPVFVFIIILGCRFSLAEEIRLKNGDRVTGDILEETETMITVDTRAMGQVTINKNFINAENNTPGQELNADVQSDIKWQSKASLGYSQTGGNTEDGRGSAEFSINRKSGDDEWTGRIKAYVSSSNDEMDAKKFYGLGRYAYSFGSGLKWYHFFKFEGDQDHFANIDYRFIPSTGLGYWFSDADDWKMMVEGAIGFQHTNYRDMTESDNEAILIPRGFLEKTLIGDLKFSEDIILYPSLTEGGDYRLHSETSLINPINDKVAWKVSFIDDFNSDPSGNTKKNDFRLISSLEYVF